jgi:hypothetical protein
VDVALYVLLRKTNLHALRRNFKENLIKNTTL